MAGNAWPEVRIGDLGQIVTGRTPPTERSSYFGNEFPFITPTDMHQGKYARITQRGISQQGAELLTRIRIPAHSVCVSCIGWQMGEVIMTSTDSFTNQQINSIVPNGMVDASFLYYSLLPRKQELLSLGAATGVRTPILNKSAFSDLKIKLPDIAIQQWIVGVLSAYDELIENNQRRIRILEDMAGMLYLQRFQQSTKEKSSFAAIATIERNSINPSDFPDEEFEHFSIPAFDRGKRAAIEIGETILSSKTVIDASSVLLSKLNPRIPRIWLPNPSGRRRAVASSEFLVLKPRLPITREYVYLTCSSSRFLDQFRSHAIGTSTSHQRVRPENLLALPCAVPDQRVVVGITKAVSPMLQLVDGLRSSIECLRQTRSLMLGRLFAGGSQPPRRH